MIISAGWTMSAVEIENTLLKHPDVKEAAVIGVPDATRGQVVKAFIVSDRSPSDDFVEELQDFTRERLSQHEFPRHIAFVSELPKTPAGKVNRKVLRDREAAAAPCRQLTFQEKTNARLERQRCQTRFPKITEEGLDDLRKRIGVTITDTVEPWNYEATRDAHPPLRARHRRRQPAVDRSRPTPRRPSTAPSSRCRASCSRPAASSRATAAACRASTPCGRARTGPGTSRCCATTSSPRRRI